tara:strand:+ start:705 stop:1133 length:429 start_codon:yes stop_codon:yes gene_type:complete
MEENKKVSLASLLTPSKTVTVDYPEFEGFTVDLCYLAREELLKLRSKCLTQKFNRKTRAFEEQMDDDKFLTEYCKAVIKGWKGLKYKYLEKMLLVNLANVKDLNGELDYSQEDAEILMKNASDFDMWVTEVVGDLENFSHSK